MIVSMDRYGLRWWNYFGVAAFQVGRALVTPAPLTLTTPRALRLSGAHGSDREADGAADVRLSHRGSDRPALLDDRVRIFLSLSHARPLVCLPKIMSR